MIIHNLNRELASYDIADIAAIGISAIQPLLDDRLKWQQMLLEIISGDWTGSTSENLAELKRVVAILQQLNDGKTSDEGALTAGAILDENLKEQKVDTIQLTYSTSGRGSITVRINGAYVFIFNNVKIAVNKLDQLSPYVSQVTYTADYLSGIYEVMTNLVSYRQGVSSATVLAAINASSSGFNDAVSDIIGSNSDADSSSLLSFLSELLSYPSAHQSDGTWGYDGQYVPGNLFTSVWGALFQGVLAAAGLVLSLWQPIAGLLLATISFVPKALAAYGQLDDYSVNSSSDVGPLLAVPLIHVVLPLDQFLDPSDVTLSWMAADGREGNPQDPSGMLLEISRCLQTPGDSYRIDRLQSRTLITLVDRSNVEVLVLPKLIIRTTEDTDDGELHPAYFFSKTQSTGVVTGVGLNPDAVLTGRPSMVQGMLSGLRSDDLARIYCETITGAIGEMVDPYGKVSFDPASLDTLNASELGALFSTPGEASLNNWLTLSIDERNRQLCCYLWTVKSPIGGTSYQKLHVYQSAEPLSSSNPGACVLLACYPNVYFSDSDINLSAGFSLSRLDTYSTIPEQLGATNAVLNGQLVIVGAPSRVSPSIILTPAYTTTSLILTAAVMMITTAAVIGTSVLTYRAARRWKATRSLNAQADMQRASIAYLQNPTTANANALAKATRRYARRSVFVSNGGVGTFSNVAGGFSDLTDSKLDAILNSITG